LVQAASDKLNRTVIVENVPGAGGTIGIEHLARRAADGASIGLLDAGILNSHTQNGKTMPALDVVAGIGLAEYALAVKPGVKDLSKLRGGNIGTTGVGTLSHLCAEAVGRHVGGLTPVPYVGAGPLLTDLLAGHLDATCLPVLTLASSVTAGKLRLAAIASSERSKRYPNVPTLEELGITNALLSSWMFIVAPPGMPAKTKAALTAAFAAAVGKTASELRKIGLEPLPAAAAADTRRLQAFLQRRISEQAQSR
jgi:tripartite-type tricarboxylate transporter receptor subunit TctC